MAMPNVARNWTREEVLALPDDGNRYELIDGELLVSPAPSAVHQRAVWRLYDRLKPYVDRHRLGEVCLAPADLDFRQGFVVQPDLFVAASNEARALLDWRTYGVPTFIAEVLSPATGRGDRTTKRPAYQDAGVGTYWIIDTDTRSIEHWEPAAPRAEICLTTAVWRPSLDIGPFVLDLAEYFAAVWGENV